MKDKVIEFEQECEACSGTGLYVVCYKCKGSGKSVFRHEYNKFTGRTNRSEVEHVFQSTCGIMVGKGKGKFGLSYFGGITYDEWKWCGAFPKGSEVRNSTCPKWWYQSVDDNKAPKWEGCGRPGVRLSDCPHFCDKEECWKRWDKENNA